MPRWLLLAIMLWTPGPLLAAGPGTIEDRSKLLSFEGVLDEIRAAQQSGEWMALNWQPQATRSYLNHLIREVRGATGRDELRVPIDFSQLKLPPLLRRPETDHGRLYVVKDLTLTAACHSLILADGNVAIGTAESCVIVARGAVTISSSRNNVILAGHYVDIVHDDSRPRWPKHDERRMPEMPPMVSLMMSGDVLSIDDAKGAICCGLNGLWLAQVDPETIALNSPPARIGSYSRSEPVKRTAPAVPFRNSAKRNPLEGKVQLARAGQGSVVITDVGAERTFTHGDPLTDVRGRPIRGLEGWTLKYVAGGYALFTDGRDFASLKR